MIKVVQLEGVWFGILFILLPLNACGFHVRTKLLVLC